MDPYLRWTKQITIDVNPQDLEKHYRERETPLANQIAIPIAEINRNTHVFSIDLEDSTGKTLKLMPRSTSVMYCLSVISGSIPIGYDPLSRFRGMELALYKWLSADLPLNSESGAMPQYCDQDSLDLVKESFRKFLDSNREDFMNQTGCTKGEVDTIIDVFCNYYDELTEFRRFVYLFAFKRVLFANIDPDNPNHLIIKCRITVPALVNVRLRALLSAEHPLPVEMDDSHFGESLHESIEIPADAQFIVTRLIQREAKKGGKTTFSKEDPKFAVITRKQIKDTNNPEKAGESEVTTANSNPAKNATGQYNSRFIKLKMKPAWVKEGNGERVFRPFSDGEYFSEAREILTVVTPTLTIRTAASVFFSIAALLLLFSTLFSSAEAYSNTCSNQQTDIFTPTMFIAIAAAALTYLSGIKSQSFLARELTTFPRRLFYCSLAAAAVGIIVSLVIKQAMLLGNTSAFNVSLSDIQHFVLWFCIAVLAACFALTLIWLLHIAIHAHKSKSSEFNIRSKQDAVSPFSTITEVPRH